MGKEEEIEKMINDEILRRVRNALEIMIDRASVRYSKKELITLLGISPYRFRSIMDGTYDAPLSTTIRIATRLGYVPEIIFKHPIFTPLS